MLSIKNKRIAMCLITLIVLFLTIKLDLLLIATANKGMSLRQSQQLPLDLTNNEKDLIEQEQNIQKRVKNCLKICDLYLVQAQENLRVKDYIMANQMLEKYLTLLKYASDQARNTKENQRKKTCQLLEIKIRRQLVVLGQITSGMPTDLDNVSKTTLNEVKEIRTQLLSNVFGKEFLK